MVKSLASALCIGGGGSVGREGPIVQIGSALGSTLGRVVRVAEPRMRVLVACGAAGGIAATFNAPLAGVFFAMELILRDFAAAVVRHGRAVVGHRERHRPRRVRQHRVPAPARRSPSPTRSSTCCSPLLGLLAGARRRRRSPACCTGSRTLCDRLWRGPEWLRPAVGGLLLGGSAAACCRRCTASATRCSSTRRRRALHAAVPARAAGRQDGRDQPHDRHRRLRRRVRAEPVHRRHARRRLRQLWPTTLMPGVAGPVGAYGLIGMGAVFAGAARAPITAVIIMFELTGEYTIILPLMAAIVLATGVSHLLSRDTIYTLKLRRRGIDIDEPDHSSALLASVRVATVMDALDNSDGTESAVAVHASLLDAADTLAGQPYGQVAVVDRDGAYLGVVTARDVTDALSDGEHDGAEVASLLRRPAAVRADQPLEDTLEPLESEAITAAACARHPDARAVVGCARPTVRCSERCTAPFPLHRQPTRSHDRDTRTRRCAPPDAVGGTARVGQISRRRCDPDRREDRSSNVAVGTPHQQFRRGTRRRRRRVRHCRRAHRLPVPVGVSAAFAG